MNVTTSVEPTLVDLLKAVLISTAQQNGKIRLVNIIVCVCFLLISASGSVARKVETLSMALTRNGDRKNMTTIATTICSLRCTVRKKERKKSGEGGLHCLSVVIFALFLLLPALFH